MTAPRLKTLFRCQNCGLAAPKWAGQCAECQAWNTLVEEVIDAARPAPSGPRALTEFSSECRALSEIAEPSEERLGTGLLEFDRLLGGGLVRGQVLLLAGPPGIGKSTLMLQAAGALAGRRRVLYVSGEESLPQVAARARRLGLEGRLLLASEAELPRILDWIRSETPDVLVVDSIQTVYHPDFSGGPGSVGQVRECAAELLRAAKARGAVLFLLGHVTKEGALAGPKVLEHMVDTVLELDTEERRLLRVLRAQKNRFGPTSEIGLFEMAEGGLREVPDASALGLESAPARACGRAVSVALEGSRPILVEVQALVSPTRYPLPRRMATGLDLNRTLVLLASLEKHLQLRLESQDVFVHVSGGLRLKDPALDLAVCLAVVSSARDIPVPPDAVFVGEVGLLGDLGRVPFLGRRLKEAHRLGFRRAWVEGRSLEDAARGGEKIALAARGVRELAGAVEALN